MAFAKTPEGILTKSEYDTPIGKLKFFDGLPDEQTVPLVPAGAPFSLFSESTEKLVSSCFSFSLLSFCLGAWGRGGGGVRGSLYHFWENRV